MQLPRVMDVTYTAGPRCNESQRKEAPKARQPRPWLAVRHGKRNVEQCCHVHVEHGEHGRSWIAAAGSHMGVRHPLLQSQIDPELDPAGDFAVPAEALKVATEKAGGWFRIRDGGTMGEFGRVEVSLPDGPQRWELGNPSILPPLDHAWKARGSDTPDGGCPFEVTVDLRLLIDAASGLGAKHSDGEIPVTLQFHSDLESIQVMLTPTDRNERPGVPGSWGSADHTEVPKNGVASARMSCSGERGAAGYLDREQHAAALVCPKRTA